MLNLFRLAIQGTQVQNKLGHIMDDNAQNKSKPPKTVNLF